MATKLVKIKATLLQEDPDDEDKTLLAIRRATLDVNLYRYTLKQLSVELQDLFAEDLKNFTAKSESYVVSYRATIGCDLFNLDCDSNVQKCFLQATKSRSVVYTSMILHFREIKTNAAGFVLPGKMEQSLAGLRLKIDPRGPFPVSDDGDVQVTQPIGAGMIHTPLDCDVVVAGGGSSGIGAALAAARSGARTVCIHGRPVLGGNASSEVKLNMVGADKGGSRGKQDETEARESGLVDEIRLDNSMANPQFCAEMLDLTFLDKFRSEPNMTLLLNTWLTGVSKDEKDENITVAFADNQITQKCFEIRSKVFIDCTGDGRLGAEAGNYWIQGRESKAQYGESLAMDVADTLTEGTSLAFHARDMGKPMPFKPPPSFKRRFTSEDFKFRHIGEIDYGYWWIEVSYPYDTVSDGDEIMHELVDALIGVWDYIKNGDGKFDADPTNWALDWFGLYPCKREARRMIGMFVQTQKDLIPEPTDFPDAVCHGGWAIDLHNPKGINDPENPPYVPTHVPYIYGTPLRCFVSSNVPNLMFAGRLSSFSHVAFGSQRVMATCMTHGQAAGTAAAYAVQYGMTPKEVAADPEAVWSIQQQLLRDDQFVVHQINQDPRDMALKAKVSATSEIQGSEAKEAISGQTRAVFGPGGCMSEQCLPGTNRWISSEVPATITLEWDSAISIGQLQFIFDTGLWRRLTFTMKSEIQKSMIWGRPMPETVKDYTVQVRAAGSTEWKTVATIEDNYQRRRVHDLNLSGQYTGLRVEVTATNGCSQARIW